MPSKRSPGRSITCRASARQSAAVSAPQRSMPVSTSTMIPSVDPAVTAAAETRGGVRRLVHRDEDPVIPGQLGQHPELGRMGHGVDHEQVVHPGGGEHRGLPHRGHGQPAGARLQLAAGEVRALVRLVVRADRGRAHLLQLARHVVDVALRRVDVEHQGGGDQLIAPLADGRSVVAPDACRRPRARSAPGPAWQSSSACPRVAGHHSSALTMKPASTSSVAEVT